mgnify:CR=1 FL=1
MFTPDRPIRSYDQDPTTRTGARDQIRSVQAKSNGREPTEQKGHTYSNPRRSFIIQRPNPLLPQHHSTQRRRRRERRRSSPETLILVPRAPNYGPHNHTGSPVSSEVNTLPRNTGFLRPRIQPRQAVADKDLQTAASNSARLDYTHNSRPDAKPHMEQWLHKGGLTTMAEAETPGGDEAHRRRRGRVHRREIVSPPRPPPADCTVYLGPVRGTEDPRPLPPTGHAAEDVKQRRRILRHPRRGIHRPQLPVESAAARAQAREGRAGKVDGELQAGRATAGRNPEETRATGFEQRAGAWRRSFWPWESQGGRALGLGRMRRPRRPIYNLAAKTEHGYEERDSRRVTQNRIRAGELRFFCCADGGGDFVAADLGKGTSPTGRAHVPVSVEAGRAGPRGRRKVLLGCAVKDP